MKVTIGHDVEVILVTDTGRPTSAIGLIGGTKAFPRPVTWGALQEDNVLAEINITPADTYKKWENYTTKVLQQLASILPRTHIISDKASAFYPMQELLSPQAKEFGCDPDFNAWTGQENPRPRLSKRFKNLRSAGGHIHIGLPGLSVDAKYTLIRVLDMVGGLQATLLDKDVQRKTLYGKAGAMRIKPYGVEWRTPSNFWLFTKESRAWAYTMAQYCARNFTTLSKLISPEVEQIINNNALIEARLYLRSLRKKTALPTHPSLKI